MRVVWEEIECVFERPNEGVVRPFDRIFRLKVPGGWLVTRDRSNQVSIIYIPDPQHDWEFNSDSRECIEEGYCRV